MKFLIVLIALFFVIFLFEKLLGIKRGKISETPGKNLERWGRAIINGMRELLLCQLEDLRREMVVEHDGVADEDLKSRSQRLYDSYHSLGGNGHGTSLNDDIQSAPIAPRNRT